MSGSRKVFAGLLGAGWVVLAVVALVWGLGNQEDDLGAKAEAALEEAGLVASVDFDGRDATLSGTLAVSDQAEAIAVVREITGVRDVRWRGGSSGADPAPTSTTATSAVTTTTTAGGATTSTTTTTTSTTTPSGMQSSLTAALTGGRLTVAGTIPSAEAAGGIAAVADLVYAPFVNNEVEVDGSVAPASWLGGVANAIALLPIVGEATLELEGQTATLSGTAGSVEKREQLAAAMASALGADVALITSIEVTGKTPPLYLASAPGDGTVTLSGVMPDQAAIDLIAGAAVDVFGSDAVVNDMVIGENIDTTFSVFRIPLTFAQFEPIPEWELRIENDVITGNVRGGATFDFGSAELTPPLIALLDTAAGILIRNPSVALTVEGHTDSVGSDLFNQGLSEARANAAVAYLTELGIPEARLTAVGYGETRPIASNATAEGRQQNRRLEFGLGPPG